MKQFIEWLKKAAVFGVLLLLWHLAAKAELWNAYILPPPEKVFGTLGTMLQTGELMGHLLVSLRRVLIGFSVSCALTFVLTGIQALFPRAAAVYRPLCNTLPHIPPISLIPLLILWFGIGELPKIIVIVLATFFPVMLNTETALFGCDPKLTEVGRSLRFSREQIFFQIMLPNAIPDILVGMRIGMSYAWRAIAGAEMIAAASGIGYFILDAQALSRTDKVIVGILVVGALGLINDGLWAWLVRLAFRRRDGVYGGV